MNELLSRLTKRCHWWANHSTGVTLLTPRSQAGTSEKPTLETESLQVRQLLRAKATSTWLLTPVPPSWIVNPGRRGCSTFKHRLRPLEGPSTTRTQRGCSNTHSDTCLIKVTGLRLDSPPPVWGLNDRRARGVLRVAVPVMFGHFHGTANTQTGLTLARATSRGAENSCKRLERVSAGVTRLWLFLAE